MEWGPLPVTSKFVLASLLILTLRWMCTQSRRRAARLRDLSSILITGGAHGIGLDLALSCAARGVPHIALADINCITLALAKQHILQRAVDTHHPAVRVHTFVVDVSDETAVAALCDKVVCACDGRLDVLVSNAGVVVGKDVVDINAADLQRSMGVNLFASFYLVRSLLPHFKANHRGGCIVLMGSVMGAVGSSRLSAYVASKYALMGFSDSLRLELARDGLSRRIPVVTVCPHATRTGMFDGAFEDARDWNPIRALFFPMLTPHAVTQSVLHCISEWRNVVTSVPSIMLPVAYLTRSLPQPLGDWVMGYMGGWHGMSSFRGHEVARDTSSELSAASPTDLAAAHPAPLSPDLGPLSPDLGPLSPDVGPLSAHPAPLSSDLGPVALGGATRRRRPSTVMRRR